jgi:uncharacterized membrane protein
MFEVRKLLSEKNIHIAFEVGLFLKGMFAAFETIGGVLAYFVTQRFILKLVQVLTQEELAEDPRDLLANYLLHQAEHLSISAQHFAGLYLLSHGAIKLALIVGLLQKKLWFYPAAIVVFGLFVLYQLYLFDVAGSVSLLTITALDIVVIVLTWHEYLYLRRLPLSSAV